MYLSLYPFLQCTVENGSCNYNISGDDTLSFSREEIANFTLNITVDECKFMHGGFKEILQVLVQDLMNVLLHISLY